VGIRSSRRAEQQCVGNPVVPLEHPPEHIHAATIPRA
jgi:hypothetical protein